PQDEGGRRFGAGHSASKDARERAFAACAKPPQDEGGRRFGAGHSASKDARERAFAACAKPPQDEGGRRFGAGPGVSKDARERAFVAGAEPPQDEGGKRHRAATMLACRRQRAGGLKRTDTPPIGSTWKAMLSSPGSSVSGGTTEPVMMISPVRSRS